MAKFRKKPVEIEAMQLTEEDWVDVLAWAKGANLQVTFEDGDREKRRHYLVLTTIHGDEAIARTGDWVIPEPTPGRFYPCKPDIFAATYEPVDDHDDRECGCRGLDVCGECTSPGDYEASDD